MFAIRGTVSNGFRAPTLAEEHYSGTNVSPYSAEVQLPPNSAAAASVGLQPLKPEQSQNYSVGFVVHPIDNMQITLDAYQINLHDRILVSGFLYGTCCTAGSAQLISQGVLTAIQNRGVSLDSGLSYTGIALFANAANTRGDYGHVDWTLGINWNKTQITKLDALPSAIANTPAQCAALPVCNTAYLTLNAASALTTANPREKIILQAFWTKDRFSLNLRETIYGPTSQWSPDNSYLQTIGTTGITDIDLGYKLTKFLKLDVGANNAFNTIPPAVGASGGFPLGGGLVFKVPYGFAPWNANGGYYYGRVTVTF